MDESATPNIHAITLDQLPAQVVGVIHRIRTHTPDGQALQRRLLELGFLPGERVQVLRRMLTGGGPMAVRVGGSTFAMRALESALIEVVPG